MEEAANEPIVKSFEQKLNEIDTSAYAHLLVEYQKIWENHKITSKDESFKLLKNQYYGLFGHPLIQEVEPQKAKSNDFYDGGDPYDKLLMDNKYDSDDRPPPLEGEEEEEFKDEEVSERMKWIRDQFYFGYGNIKSNNLILFNAPSKYEVEKKQLCGGQAKELLEKLIGAFGGIDKCYVGFVYPFCLVKEESQKPQYGLPRPNDNKNEYKKLQLSKIKDNQLFVNLAFSLIRIIRPRVLATIGYDALTTVECSYDFGNKKYIIENGVREWYHQINMRNLQFPNHKIDTINVFPLKRHPFAQLKFREEQSRRKKEKEAFGEMVAQEPDDWEYKIELINKFVVKESTNIMSLLKTTAVNHYNKLDIKKKEKEIKNREIEREERKRKLKEAALMKYNDDENLTVKKKKKLTMLDFMVKKE